jgi:hypothetical protein
MNEIQSYISINCVLRQWKSTRNDHRNIKIFFEQCDNGSCTWEWSRYMSWFSEYQEQENKETNINKEIEHKISTYLLHRLLVNCEQLS